MCNVVDKFLINVIVLSLQSSLCIPTHISIVIFIHSSICPPIHSSIHSFICLSIHLFVHPFIYLSIHSFVCPSITSFIHPLYIPLIFLCFFLVGSKIYVIHNTTSLVLPDRRLPVGTTGKSLQALPYTADSVTITWTTVDIEVRERLE